MILIDWISRKLFKKKEKLDPGLKFSPGPSIRVEGKVYSARIDSMEVLKKVGEMQGRISALQDDLSSKPHNTLLIVESIKDFVLMLLGQDGYSGIFDTPEKRDSYAWHVEVFGALFGATIEYKMQAFSQAVNSPVLGQIKKAQARMNRAQRRHGNKGV